MTDMHDSTRDRIVRYIRSFHQREDMWPTIREIGDGVGRPSPGNVYYHLKILERAGTITWLPGKSRSVRLNISPRGGIPIIGTIAAGVPLDHYQQSEYELLDGDPTASPNTFALRVKGDSMIDDYIGDGDLIIIERDQPIRDGDIVVATHLVSAAGDGAATLKRLYRERERCRIRLQPANAAVEPIYVDAAEWDREWQVQGKAIGLRRHW